MIYIDTQPNTYFAVDAILLSIYILLYKNYFLRKKISYDNSELKKAVKYWNVILVPFLQLSGHNES